MRAGAGSARPHAEVMYLREVAARWLDAREVSHRAKMSNGLCRSCYGFADDPRHWAFSLDYVAPLSE
jgi:hypothetical protein